MLEGVFKVTFGTPLGSGAGVVTLSQGRISGGDSAIYYVGTYSQEGDRFVANVTTGRHTNDPSFQNVFGKDRVQIDVSGTIKGDAVDGRGQSPDAPGVSLTMSLSRLSS